LSKPKRCTVEIVSIGNELLLGNTINTNASWIAKRITSEGGRVSRVTVVGDILAEIIATIREALRRRPDYIITTGGIGPTFDDMTIKAVARLLRQSLHLDVEALGMIKEHYSKRFPTATVKLTKARLKMAMLPVRGSAIFNPVGTAPAVRVKAAGTEIFCLPGVPREAKAIFNGTIATQIQHKAGDNKFVERWIQVTGVMESTLAPIVEQTMNRWPQIYIKSHPRRLKGSTPIIELHLSALSSTPRETSREVLTVTNFLAKKLRSLGGRIIPAK
jgi:molybdenum cofactor synthesis domain-containing protein